MSQLNTTEQFLLECTRENSKDDLESTLESFLQKSHNIDWLLVAKTVPYIYLKAKNFSKDFKIPEEARNEIQELYFWHTARNERIKYEVVKLGKKFSEAQIPLIFLKGAALLTTVYDKNTDLRTMEDVDALVRRDNLRNAEEVLKNIGYEAEETKEEREIFLREHFHFKYFKKELGFNLELHWDIGEQWHWDTVEQKGQYLDILFGSSQKITVKNTEIKTLNPAGNLFIACFNFERDLCVEHRIIYSPFVYLPKYRDEREQLVYHSLRFFCEIKKMLAYYGRDLNWTEFFSLTRAAKKEYEVFTLLFLSAKIVKADISEIVLKRMKQNIFVRLYISLCRLIPYGNFTTLFFLNRVIYRMMLIWSYIYNRKFYLLGLRILGGRV